MGLSDRNVDYVGKAGYSVLLHILREGKTHSMAREERVFFDGQGLRLKRASLQSLQEISGEKIRTREKQVVFYRGVGRMSGIRGSQSHNTEHCFRNVVNFVVF